MSSKSSKSSASEASSIKPSSPATPRVSKLSSRGAFKSDADSPSPLQKGRLSVDQSPRSVTSKPVPDRKIPKTSLTPDKLPTRAIKGLELQAQLTAAQEDLKKAKEKLSLSEKEKAQATKEAIEAKKLAEEANEKLREALVAQKRAEEDSEIEKFRALEFEQFGIDTTEKKDEEWQKELESVRNQHSLDLNALITTTEELQRVNQELAITTETKNQALAHADDATKIAEIHAEKMELLSAELARMKALTYSKLDEETNEKSELISRLDKETNEKSELISRLDKETNEKSELMSRLDKETNEKTELISLLDKETNEKSKLISQLNLEVKSLKLELEKIKIYEEKLMKKEDCIEQLNVELEATNLAESYARNLVEEWMKKAGDLEVGLEEANRLRRSLSESLEAVNRKFEESNSLLHGAQSEISSLNEKVDLLETSISQQRGDIEESEHCLEMAKAEAAEMSKKIGFLTYELTILKEKNIQALNNEQVAADSFQSLLEEKNKLVKELENVNDENEQNKVAMESLTAALHEVSAEARETKEKLLSSESENENYKLEVENMRFSLKSMTEKYEGVVDDTKHRIDILNESLELSKHEYESSKEDWEKREHHFMDCVKQLEEERSLLDNEFSRLTTLLKEKEDRYCALEKKEASIAISLKEVETEATHLKEALGEAKSESMRAKDDLLDKENELQSFIHEIEELRNQEAVSLKKIEELSKSLEETMVKKQNGENGEISDTEKDYDVLPKVVEFSEQNGFGKEDNLKVEFNDNRLDNEVQNGSFKFQNFNGNYEDKKSKEKDDGLVEVDSKMWASCKIEENEFTAEKSIEQESFREEGNLKVENAESYDHFSGLSSSETQENGETSPLEQQSQKKKKPLLKKFGNLLKKKSTNNQKSSA